VRGSQLEVSGDVERVRVRQSEQFGAKLEFGGRLEQRVDEVVAKAE